MAKPSGRPPRLTEEIINKITADFIQLGKIGGRLPAENELARHYAVNRRTIRAALAGLEKNGAITRKTHRGTFIGLPYRGEWRDHVGQTVGLSFRQTDWLEDVSCRQFVRGLLPAFAGTGLKLAFSTQCWAWGMDLVHTPATHYGGAEIVGLVHIGQPLPNAAESFLTLRKPTVAVDFDGTTLGWDSVVFDNYGAGALLAKRIVKHGHRRIVMVVEAHDRPPHLRDEAWDKRRQGFLSVWQKQELPPPMEIVLAARGRSAEIPRAVKDLLRKPPNERPTAIVLPINQLDEIEASANELGLYLPRDFSVVGYGEATDESRLAGFRFDSRELGRQAALRLMHKIQDPKWWKRPPLLRKVKGRYAPSISSYAHAPK
jgi:hypothetical protein